MVGIQLLNFQREEDEKNIRRRTAVTMAVNTLSYSELRAVSAILAELDGNEGQLTASVIADRIGITRSVIVNALRKLESAGIAMQVDGHADDGDMRHENSAHPHRSNRCHA